jgi:dynein heavy chain
LSPATLCRSLGAFVEVFSRGLDSAPGGHKKREEEEHVTLRQLQKRVSGNAQDYEEVIRRAKRQSSMGGGPAPSSQSSSKRVSAHGSGATVPHTPTGGNTVPPTPGARQLAGVCVCVGGGAPPAPAEGLPDTRDVTRATAPTAGPVGTQGARSSVEFVMEEEEAAPMTPEQLEARITSLLDTCTYTVFSYTRRGLFDRDKLIVLTLLSFQILLRSGSIDAAEYEALCKGARSTAPPPVTDDLSRCGWGAGVWGAAGLHVRRVVLAIAMASRARRQVSPCLTPCGWCACVAGCLHPTGG